MKRTEMAYSIREDLRVLPDVERLVARVRGLAGSPDLGVIPMAAKKVHERRVSFQLPAGNHSLMFHSTNGLCLKSSATGVK